MGHHHQIHHLLNPYLIKTLEWEDMVQILALSVRKVSLSPGGQQEEGHDGVVRHNQGYK